MILLINLKVIKWRERWLYENNAKKSSAHRGTNGFYFGVTKLIDFYIEGNRAYVDLNKAYDEAHHGDNMVVANLYSIFYTLTLNEIFSIDEVQLLVDGDTILAPMGRISLEVMTPQLRTQLLSRTSFYPGQNLFEE